MDLEISVSDRGADAILEDLLHWLMGEQDLRRAVRLRTQPMANNELGAAVDVLIVALSSGGAASVLAASLKAWFAQPKRDNISISVRWPDGSAVDVNAHNVNDVKALLSVPFKTP
jgi:hypothetical protein